MSKFIEIEDGAYQRLGVGGKDMLVKDCKLPVINPRTTWGSNAQHND